MRDWTIKLFFIRHGEHDKNDWEYNEYNYPLTEKGIQEIHKIREKINANITQTIWFTANNTRSMQSCIVAMWWWEEQRLQHTEFLKHKRIQPLKELSYLKANDNMFSDGLLTSIKEKKVMRRTINNSDRLMQELWYKQSAFSVMAEDVSNILLRYHKILNTWNKVNHTYVDKNLYRIFCGKEFIYASFRAKIIDLLYGNNEKEAYIDWYEKHIENKWCGRREIGMITVEEVSDCVKFRIKDSYWEEIIEKTMLDIILKPTFYNINHYDEKTLYCMNYPNI